MAGWNENSGGIRDWKIMFWTLPEGYDTKTVILLEYVLQAPKFVLTFAENYISNSDMYAHILIERD